MTATRFTLPDCLRDGLGAMFPTLDFDRVEFVWDAAVGAEGKGARTSARPWRVVIAVDPGQGTLCSSGVFELLVHELVHVLQITSGRWSHQVSSLVCGWLRGKDAAAAYGGPLDDDHPYNCIERQAYDFQFKAGGKLSALGRQPCVCGPAGIPWLAMSGLATANPAFPDSAELERLGCVIREAGCGPSVCIGDSLVDRLWGGALTIVAAVGVSIAYFWDRSAVSSVGLAIGAVAGATIGWQLAGVIGVLLGGVLGAFLGALIGTLVSALGGWLFGGTRGGSLNLLFSSDGGASFGSKTTFERTEQPMALAFGHDANVAGRDRLAISWIGTDDQVNLITVPARTRISFERSESSGPALVQNGVRLHVGWQGTDNGLNLVSTWDGISLQRKRDLHESSLDNATPALAEGRGHVFVSWIGRDNHINIARSQNGFAWTDKLTLNERSESEGTPALALNAGALHVAWVGTDKDHHLNVMEIPVQPNGAMSAGHKHVLPETSSRDAGPALASYDNRLYLAWTGSDGRVNICVSTDAGRSFHGKQTFERSRRDCGPALAVHADGTICLGWVGTA